MSISNRVEYIRASVTEEEEEEEPSEASEGEGDSPDRALSHTQPSHSGEKNGAVGVGVHPVQRTLFQESVSVSAIGSPIQSQLQEPYRSSPSGSSGRKGWRAMSGEIGIRNTTIACQSCLSCSSLSLLC